ncbi:MAG TPA: hypothetical protein PK812_05390 [Beijerinckiaceae bacterium]|nr:hypothetical protein [Beijerinckiaceae bacterium]
MWNVVRNAVVAAGLGVVLVGCQGVPANYKPPVDLKNASVPKIQNYLHDTCIRSQRAKQSLDTQALSKACQCYSQRAVKAADKADLDFLRDKGYFSDAARPKIQTVFNACGLK